jgi:alpha-amylase/alpha-mannosidase (GH57 family)
MSHNEFLKLVTPQEMYSSAGINAMEQLQFAFTNWLGQSLIRKAVEELKDAKTERDAQEIRERIDRELSALTGSVRGK